MNHAFQAARRLLWLPLAAALLAVALPVAARTHHTHHKQTQASSDSNTVVHDISGTTVNELRSLMASKSLTELRTTYNGTYGASLLFYANKLTYYVVLFHNKDFWRVIKTTKVAEAESVYKTFVAQSYKLAQVDIDTIRLEAGKKYSQHLLAVNNQRLQTLRKDLQRQHAQAQQIAKDQQQAKQQAINLSQSLQSTSSQLSSLQQRIKALQQQQADLKMQLPSVQQQQPAPSASAAASADPATAAPAATTSAMHKH